MAKFKDLKDKLRDMNYMHYMCLSMVLISINLAIYIYSLSWERLFQNIVDLWDSLKYYFSTVYMAQEDVPINISSVENIDLTRIVTYDIEALIRKFDFFGMYFWDGDNFQSYCLYLSEGAFLFVSIGSLLIPIFILLIKIIKNSYLNKGDEEDKYKDTKQLAYFKAKIEPKIIAAWNWLKSFVEFIRVHNKYIKWFVFIWLINVNFSSICFGVISLYFYFVSSFKISIVGDVLIKLGADLLIMLLSVNVLVWLIIVYLIATSIMKKVAYSILEHNEMKNRGFVNSLPLGILICGTMGSKKSTTVADITLSFSVIFKYEALKQLIKYDSMFPNFPWLRFEDDLKRCYEEHVIYNWASTKLYIVEKSEIFADNPCKENIWGYDFEKYPMYYDDDLKISNIFEVLCEYAKAYLLYVVESSLIFGNMSIREDISKDNGFFPMWNTDFFHKTPLESYANTRFAHIFDYDMFRLGKKMIENNQNSNAFEFGVVALTEIGKERKNNLENRELKKKDSEANQNNDLFNTTIKMIRHRATVGYYPFVRVIADEQRPESLGADVRDLFSVINIVETSERKVLYRGLFFDNFFHDIIFPKINSFYREMRNLRGDNTLLVYLLNNIVSWSENRYDKLTNRFGYYDLNFEISKGSLDGEIKKYVYKLSSKKAYMERFASDCFNNLFENMALRSSLGLLDFPCYEDIKQSEEEMKLQNSYFYNDMVKWGCFDK
ncbi:MAG: hypothetical protein J6A95_01730 [Clostridia bacterium]|nr:hypothetical protein [Clostridia bacterium]